MQDTSVVKMNEITCGDSFELIKQVPNGSINLLLTDPPYFLDTLPSKNTDKKSGFKGIDWDSSISLLENEWAYTYKKSFDLASTDAERLNILKKVKRQYFRRLMRIIEPKMAMDSTMIIFNRLENIETMQDYLSKRFFTQAEWLAGGREQGDFTGNTKKWQFNDTIEWLKTNPSHQIQPLYRSEYALLASNVSGKWTFLDDVKNTNNDDTLNDFDIIQLHHQTSILDTDNLIIHKTQRGKSPVYGDNTGHATPKPFGLWSYLIRRFSEPQDTVLDLFSGSGTTALVATDLNRKFYAFEFDPEQVSLSQQRLDAFNERHEHSLFVQHFF